MRKLRKLSNCLIVAAVVALRPVRVGRYAARKESERAAERINR